MSFTETNAFHKRCGWQGTQFKKFTLNSFLEYLHVFIFVVKQDDLDRNLFSSDDGVRKIHGQEKWLEYSKLNEHFN